MSETGYLCVDEFMTDLVGVRALATALELGLVDFLLESRGAARDVLAGKLGIDGKGLDILLGLLAANGVVEENGRDVRITGMFARALEYRDLLEVKIEFSNLCARDLIDHFSSLVTDPDRFLRSAGLFELFDYGHAVTGGPESVERTRRWMRITTTLTKYEAQVAMLHHDFSGYGHILDIGGNSGEFMLRVCRKYPGTRATIIDLPLVCEIGRRHVAGQPEAGRISFLPGDALSGPLPGGCDAVTFKSVLHDWPDDVAGRFLAHTAGSVKPGGTILIFERGPIEDYSAALRYSMAPFLLFSRFFRTPELYAEQLEDLGFRDITIKKIELEMPFYMVTAVRNNFYPPGGGC